MKRNTYLVVALIMLLATVLSACTAVAPAPAAAPAAAEATAAAAEATAAPAAEAAKPLKIAFSVPDMAFPFFVFMETQVRAEADALGGIEIQTLDGQNNLSKQTADVEAAIAQGVDGIVISPITSDGMAPAVQQAIDAGIPVITVDRSVTGVTGLLAHVGADNVKGGEQQGQAIVDMFPDGATIFELQGTPGASPAIDRSKGLHNIIDPVTAIKVACQQTANFHRPEGLTVTENCLGATPNPDAIVAANDDMALGSIEAVKAANLTTPIIGYDALPEALKAVQDGSLYGTVEQFPGEQAKTALRTLVSSVRDGTAPESDVIYITPKLITKDNINEAERIGEVQ
jgi:ABC-type sugar transport system substrate-binding protein